MDPLSLTASVIAVITAAGTVASGLKKLQVIANATDELLALMTEVSDIQIVLEEVNDALRAQGGYGEHMSLNLAKLLIRAKTTLLRLNKVIQTHVAKSQASGTSPSGPKVARLTWMMERSTVRTLQEDLRLIRLNLATTLASGNAIGISRINLKVEEVSFITNELKQFQVDQHRETSVMLLQQAEMLQEVCRALGADSMLGGSNPPVDRLSTAVRPPLPNKSVTQTSNTQTISHLRLICVKASRLGETLCSPVCSCACHGRIQIKTPAILHKIIGSLFIGYTGFPGITPRCDERSCSRKGKITGYFNYVFPAWLLARAVMGRIAPAPELLLRMVGVLPSRSPVFQYAMLGNVSGITQLFEKGLASPFDIAESGSSMLHFALNSSRFNVCKLLLDLNVDPYYQSRQDARPIDIAWDRILGSFEPRSVEMTLISLFSSSDYLETRQFSIIHKVVLGVLNLDLQETLEGSTSHIDETDSNNRSALSWAAMRADTQSVQTLLKYKADTNSRDILGKTALHFVREPTITGCLLAAGVQVDSRDIYQRTALHAACRRGPNLEHIRLLIVAGADVNAVDDWNRTSLSYASQFDYVDVVECLLESTANIEIGDVDGFSPLLTAIESSSCGVIPILLTHGADYNAVATNGEGVLDIAVRSADIQTLRLLADARLEGLNAASYSGSFQLLRQARAATSEDLAAAIDALLSSNDEIVNLHQLKKDEDDHELYEDAAEYV